MTSARRPLRLVQYFAYLLSWVVFAVVGLGLNIVTALMLLLPGRRRHAARVRGWMRWLFSGWCAWLHATRLVYVRFNGFTPDALSGPAVYVANHPGLMDATFVLARLPDAICIFKPAIMRNPFLAPAAIMAGYVKGDTGVDLIRDVAARVTDGSSLLIFPEGTRTVPHRTLNPLKPGFALIATRARVGVRVIVIRAPRDLLPKGWPWWRAPRFPAQVDVTLVSELELQPGETANELTERTSREFLAALAQP